MPRPAHYETPTVRIDKLIVGPFENNVFVVRCTGTGEAVIIDAANEHELLLEVSRATGVRRVLTTHGHWDHIQAVDAVRDAGIDVGIAPDDASMLPAYDFVIPDDEVIAVGDLRLRTIHNPGHTPGSTSFLLEGHPILFSGDTLFPGGAGNTRCPAATSSRSSNRSTDACSRSRPTSSCCPATASTPPSAPSDPICRSGSTAAGELGDAAGQRRLLVRQRQEVQALPQDARCSVPARSDPNASCPPRSRVPTTRRPARRSAPPSPMVKAPDVIERMRHAGRIARDVLAETGAAVAVGVTTDELDRVAHEAHVARGVYPSPLRYRGFPKSVCTSVNEVICHGIPDDRALVDGDIVNLDITVYRRRRPRRHQRDLLRRATSTPHRAGSCASPRSASTSSIEAVRPGAPLSDIGRAIETHAHAAGFFVVRAFVGHGIGEVFHGPPQVPHYYERASAPCSSRA